MFVYANKQPRGGAAGFRPITDDLLADFGWMPDLPEALAKMTDAARMIMILDRLPKLIELTGEAGEKIARATFSGIAAPLGNIDSIHIVDMGGNGKGPSTALRTGILAVDEDGEVDGFHLALPPWSFKFKVSSLKFKVWGHGLRLRALGPRRRSGSHNSGL